jgi:hypothetical protein
MALETAFLELMQETVTVYSQTAKNEYGVQTWGSGTTVNCRVMETGSLVHDANGRQVYESGKIIFYGTPTVSLSSRIGLSDGSYPVLLSVNVYRDQSGLHHTSVSFGRA